ncbi:MAG: T9SS type A sorting domain-containing protein [Chitinophagaceae bacterium]
MYPNPAGDFVTVKFSESTFSGPVKIRIADELDRILYTKRFLYLKAGKIDLLVSSLKTVSYYLQANGNGKVFSVKFIKQAP